MQVLHFAPLNLALGVARRCGAANLAWRKKNAISAIVDKTSRMIASSLPMSDIAHALEVVVIRSLLFQIPMRWLF